MSERADEVFDQLVDSRLRGESLDIEAFLASRPELSEAEREKLRTLAASLEVSWVREALRPPAPAPLPEPIGPYRLLARLGRGGQGVVYLAEDARCGRRCALKVLSRGDVADDSSGADAVMRLRRELEIVSRLDHPGICKLYEYGVQDDTHYVAMQFVEGETLAHRIATAREHGAVPTEPELHGLLALVEQAARVLHVAHEAGVVHRDVKPGNIMLTPDGRAVLLDFGLAKSARSDSSEVTQLGRVVGSPAFMSPEQLRPGRELDPRTDVYSLGVTLYECLTLHRPFEAQERAELFAQIREGRLPDPRRFNPRLGEPHKRVLETALEPELRHRYPSALALAEDLRRLLRGEPLVARAPGPLRRGTRWLKRHPRGVAASATSLVLLGSLFLALSSWNSERRSRVEADGTRRLAQARAALATNPYAALLLAIEGAEQAPGPIACDTLLDVLDEQNERRMLQAHAEPVTRCLRGPGAGTLITASQDHSLRVWDTVSWSLVRVLEGHEAPLCDAVLSRDGRLLASLSNDGVCRLWNTDAWSCSRTLVSGAAGRPRVPGFDSLGRLVTCAGNGSLQLWDARRGELLSTLGAPDAELLACELDDEGRRALCLTVAGGLRVWELGLEPRLILERTARGTEEFQTAGFDHGGQRVLVVTRRDGAQVVELATHRESPLELLVEAGPAFAFAPRGESLLLARPDGSLGLWDPATGAYLRDLHGNPTPIQRALFTADGARLLTCSDATASLWDPQTGERLETFRGHADAVVDALVEPGAESLITAALDGTVREWALESEGHRTTLLLGKRDLVAAHFDPRGQRIVCSGYSGWVQLVELASRRCVLEFRASNRELHNVVFGTAGTTLLSASSDRSARRWDATTGALLAELAHPAPVWDVQESADGLRLLTAAEDGRARLWDARTGQLQLELIGHEGGVRCARFVGDGSRILTSSESEWDGSLRLWDAASGAELAVLRAPGARPISVSADPEGRFALAVGWWGGTQLWDLENRRLVRAWQSNASHGWSATFSPDGACLLTSGSRPVAAVWNALDGTPRMTLEDDHGIPSVSEFRPDGRWILTASSLGRLHLWPAEPLTRARELATRELGPAERARLGF